MLYNAHVPVADQIEGLLADLSAITDVARAGVISRRAVKLEKGETRPAAVMYLDVVGFTALARALDSEQLSTLIDRTFRIFELTVQGEGGYLDKVVGDAALYVFAGHPNHPPVCEAALRAALRLKERAEQVNASLGDEELAIAVRIGVAFGDVTRQQVGGQAAQVTVMGETANIAQRLEACAQPGAIQTTIRVLEKAGDVFAHVKLGKREVKGFGAVTVYEVTGIHQMAVELRGAFSELTPLAGREEELRWASGRVGAWLEQQHDPANFDIVTAETPLRDHNRLLIISGPTAVGKSRLAYELLEQLKAERGVVSATAHCSERASIRGFTAELAAVAGVNADNLSARWEQLCNTAAQAVSPEYAQRQRRHLPLLAYVLGCGQVDTGGIAQADTSSFETSCRLALRACSELAAHWRGKPVVLVIEDLQWLQDLRHLLTDLLSSSCLPWPLIVVGTARPEYNHEDGALGEGEACRVELEALQSGSGDQMIAALLPGLRLPAQLLEELHSRASGIPYYYEEFARMLVRRGLVIEGPAGCALTGSIEHLDVPEDIRALILGRLDQLDPELKALAMRASVLGRSFDCPLLTDLERELGYGTEDHPEIGLASLTAQRVLARETCDRYFFEHLLLRDVAYSSLLKNNRRVLHGAAASVLTHKHVSGAADEWSVLRGLVQHLAASDRPMEVHECACEFLMLMTQTGRDDEWVRWETLAEESWAALRAASSALPAVSACLLRAQAARHWRHGALEEAHSLYLDALGAACEQGDRKSEARILGGMGILHASLGRGREARECYEQALALARESELRADEARLLGNLGNVYQREGLLDEALSAYEQALAISQEVEDSRGEGMILTCLGVLHSHQGRKDKSLSFYEQALDLSRSVGNRIGESAALTNIGALHTGMGQTELALEFFRESLSIDREIGDRLGEGYNLFNQGYLLLEQGDITGAEQQLLPALGCFRLVENPNAEGMTLACLGEVLRRQGRLTETERCLSDALRLLKESGDNQRLGMLHCQRVRYYLDKADRDAATAALHEAEAISESLHAAADSDLGRAISEARQHLEGDQAVG